jgi:hypothetical protein
MNPEDDLPVHVWTPEWARRAKAAIEAKRVFDESREEWRPIQKREVAEAIDCDPGQLTKILAGGVTSSEHIAALSRFLEITPSIAKIDTPIQYEIVRLVAGVDPDEAAAVLTLLRRSQGKSPQ